MPISCHFRDGKVLLVTSSRVSSAIASTRPLPFLPLNSRPIIKKTALYTRTTIAGFRFTRSFFLKLPLVRTGPQKGTFLEMSEQDIYGPGAVLSVAQLTASELKMSVSHRQMNRIMSGCKNKKAQLSLTNPRDACEKFARFT